MLILKKWSIDSADSSDYKNMNNKGVRFIFILFDHFSKNTWAITFKNENAQPITQEVSVILTTSKR